MSAKTTMRLCALSNMKHKRNPACLLCGKRGKYFYSRKLIRWLNNRHDLELDEWTGVYLCPEHWQAESEAYDGREA